MNLTTYDFIDELKAKYSMEFDILKDTFSTQKDIDILLAIDKAYKAICKYCGWITVPAEYITATIQLASIYLNGNINVNKSVSGERTINSITQGSRSVSYGSNTVTINSNGLTTDIIAMLPLPKLRCFD